MRKSAPKLDLLTLKNAGYSLVSLDSFGADSDTKLGRDGNSCRELLANRAPWIQGSP